MIIENIIKGLIEFEPDLSEVLPDNWQEQLAQETEAINSVTKVPDLSGKMEKINEREKLLKETLDKLVSEYASLRLDHMQLKERFEAFLQEEEDAKTGVSASRVEELIANFKRYVIDGLTDAQIERKFKELELIDIAGYYGEIWTTQGTKNDKVKNLRLLVI